MNPHHNQHFHHHQHHNQFGQQHHQQQQQHHHHGFQSSGTHFDFHNHHNNSAQFQQPPAAAGHVAYDFHHHNHHHQNPFQHFQQPHMQQEQQFQNHQTQQNQFHHQEQNYQQQQQQQHHHHHQQQQQEPQQQHASVAASSPPRNYHPAPDVLLLFDHRALIDVTDADALDADAWQEALASFGISEINHSTFLESFSQHSESEVMIATCPFTTRLEWPSVLNKRHVVMTRELREWVSANAAPVTGVGQFIDKCTAAFSSSSSTSDQTSDQNSKTTNSGGGGGVISLFLTPWQTNHANMALAAARLDTSVAAVTALDSRYVFHDALEAFCLKPVLETPESLTGLARHRHISGDFSRGAGDGGDAAAGGAAAAAASAQQQHENVLNSAAVAELQARRAHLRPIRACTQNERAYQNFQWNQQNSINQQQQQTQSLTRVFFFTGSARMARIATSCGVVAIGVSYNSFDQEEDEKVRLPGADDEQALLSAGCRVVIPDFSRFEPEYLRML